MERSYFTTMILLFLHQIDAAYWHEWEMFFLPGGIQGFLFFNLLALPLVVLGYRYVLLKKEGYKMYAYIVAGLGVLTFVIHSAFWLAGYGQFSLVLSAATIILCLFSSLWLAWEVKQERNG